VAPEGAPGGRQWDWPSVVYSPILVLAASKLLMVLAYGL
jgi:hypothetical protein